MGGRVKPGHDDGEKMADTRDCDDSVLLIGAGKMGTALLRGWLTAGYRDIQVVEPNPGEALRSLAQQGNVRVFADFAKVDLECVEAAVIAVKPQVLKAQTVMLQHLGATRAIIVSIAAGVTTGFLRSGCGPSCDVIRAMPNLAGAIAKGIVALHAPLHTAHEDRELAESLMKPLGETLWVEDESLIDAVTATSGSGPAYVFYLVECLAAAAVEQGFAPDVAARIARATITGAGALLDADPRPPEALRKDVTSPGGTTEAALKVLAAPDGLEPLIKRTVAAAAARAKELGKG
jgi:pyrroline-5-carboxylate reductase